MKKILLAEDNSDDRALFKEGLTTACAGCELLVAENGVQLTEMLSESIPEMLFLDMKVQKGRSKHLINFDD